LIDAATHKAAHPSASVSRITEEITMFDELTKAQVLDTLRTERTRWEALLAEVGEARMTEEIQASWWSIKDVIAHVTWYERQTAEALQPALRHRPTRDWLWDLTAAKRNAILYTEYRDRPLAALRAEAQQVFEQLVAAIEALTEAEVRDPARFPNLPPGWQPWRFIARHSYEHYREHTPRIRAWLDGLGPEAAPPSEPAVAAGTQAVTPAAAAL
jgi:uncharacterized damage-inducible protein DinB